MLPLPILWHHFRPQKTFSASLPSFLNFWRYARQTFFHLLSFIRLINFCVDQCFCFCPSSVPSPWAKHTHTRRTCNCTTATCLPMFEFHSNRNEIIQLKIINHRCKWMCIVAHNENNNIESRNKKMFRAHPPLNHALTHLLICCYAYINLLFINVWFAFLSVAFSITVFRLLLANHDHDVDDDDASKLNLTASYDWFHTFRFLFDYLFIAAFIHKFISDSVQHIHTIYTGALDRRAF